MKNILDFLKVLEKNNNREWFAENKDMYEKARQEFLAFTEILLLKLKEIDSGIDATQAKECVYRIYRDARFSKNKAPYKNNMGAAFAHRGRKSPFAGYYLHIEPGNSFVGGGMYMPQIKVLKEVRNDIFDDPTQLRKIISDSTFVSTFSEMYENRLKTAPRGFPKDFHEVELLRYKSYVATRKISNEELLSEDLMDNLLETYKVQKPLNDYLNQIVGNIDDLEI